MSVRIADLASSDLDRVERLWVGVHHHHQTIAPGLGPYVDDATTWRVRRGVYEQALAGGGFALIASRDGRDVGYALARRRRPPWPATFRTSDTVVELESLAVADTERGRGIGTLLMDEVDRRLDELDLPDRLIGAIATNDRAVALYRRRGYLPTMLTVSRFHHAEPPPPAPVGVATVLPGDVDALRPLWLEHHHHDRAIGEALGPFVDDEDSWLVGGDLLAHAPETEILLRTGSADAPTAFAWLSIERDDPLWGDTWSVGRDVADLHMLAVSARARDDGLGPALMDAVDRLLAERGVRDQVIGAIPSDSAALRLYAGRGFQPTWLELTNRRPGLSGPAGSQGGGARA